MTIRERRGVVGWAALLLALAVAAPVSADWEKGVAAYKSKDWAAAATEFEEVTKTNPDFAGGYYMLGICQSNLNQLSPAVANLRKAVELEGDNAQYKLALCQALAKTGEYQQAYSLLKPLSIGSLDPRLRSNYALLFAQAATKTNRPEEAIQVLDGQIKADGKNDRLYQALGVAYNDAGNDGKAFGAFKSAFELNPKNQDVGRSAVHSGIAAARRASSDSQKNRHYSDTAQIAERLVAAAPTFEHKLLAGEAWLGAKNYQKALSWFDQAQTNQPNNVLVRYYRAQCKTSLNQLDGAIDELQQALRIGASGKLRNQIYTQMGYVYDKKGDYNKAADAYQEAGNSRKVTEMRDKEAAAAQNRQADEEQRRLRQNIEALELQIQELEKIGEMDDANELRKQLEELKKHLQ
jgi:tetratricopeptide (TPR) repeat protein